MRARRVLAVLLAAFGALAAVSAARLHVDNRLERWTSGGGEEARRYGRFLETFGSDEFVFVTLTGSDVLAPSTLDRLLPVVGELEAIDGVRRVQGLPVLYRDRFGGEDPEALADEATSTPFYRDLFLSDDGRTLGLLVQVAPAADAKARRLLTDAVRGTVAPLEATALEVHVVGSTVLAATLDRLSDVEARRSFALALAGSLLVLGLLLRSWRALAVAVACSGLALVLTLGLLAAAGGTLNMVTSALPPLLWVLAIGNLLHLLLRYRSHRVGLDQAEALRVALAETTRPCTLAAVTTAAGFASLATAPMAPVRDLGWSAAVGVLVALAVNLTVGPVLIERLRVPASRSGGAALPVRWERGALARPGLVVAVAAAVLLGSAAAVPWLRAESNPLHFLPDDDPTVRDYRAVAGRLGGFYTMEVMVDTPQPWYLPRVAARLDELAEAIAASPVVTRVVSPLDVLRKARQWEHGLEPGAYRLPASRGEAETLLATLDERGREALDELEAGATVRLSAVVGEMDEGRFLDLVRDTEAAVEELPAGYSAVVTGQVLRLVRSQQTLVATQLRSLGLALVLVFGTLAVGLRSGRLLGTAVLPNLLPLAVVFALMAVLGWPLDPATVMVSSIALGIAVDNTAHVLAHLRSGLDRGAAPGEAVREVLRRVGPAMVTTTVTAVVGFAALVSSDFLPVRAFGILASVAMVVALLGDLVVLPASVVAWRRS